MDLSVMSNDELVFLYSSVIKEMKNRGVLRTGNVTGELGERIVIDIYGKNGYLPTLTAVPLGTENYNAIDSNGKRYSVKSTSGHVTGVFYGLEPPDSKKDNPQLFDYVIICKLDDTFSVEGIYQLTWAQFLKYKKWHSRMKAWNLSLTNALKNEATVVLDANKGSDEGVDQKEVLTWLPKEKINHQQIRKAVAQRLSKLLKTEYVQNTSSRYMTEDRSSALFILSASYSEKNQEFWFSIDYDLIPWLELFPQAFVAFALGSDHNVLLFNFMSIREMLSGCISTKADESLGKKAHYHIAFSVDGHQIYFKKKLPERDFINVTSSLV